MSEITPRGVPIYSTQETVARQTLIARISRFLELRGYQPIEVPSLVNTAMFAACTAGTENKMFDLGDGVSLAPEFTNYVRDAGHARLGSSKVYYVGRAFRNESTTDSERLREFTQIGVELLGANALDCRKVVRQDAIGLFNEIAAHSPSGWRLEDNVKRGLNLYDESGKTFEIHGLESRKQLLGGGPYKGGAGWALGLERVMKMLGN